MQFIIRLSLSILLGVMALAVMVGVCVTANDFSKAAFAAHRLNTMQCSELIQHFKASDKKELLADGRAFMQGSNLIMKFVDKDLLSSSVGFDQMLKACVLNPKLPLRKVLVGDKDQDLVDNMIARFNVVDSDTQDKNVRRMAPVLYVTPEEQTSPTTVTPTVAPTMPLSPTTTK